MSAPPRGENKGCHCDSGPPCTVTTTGNGPSPSGLKRKTGISSPSKLAKRWSSGSIPSIGPLAGQAGQRVRAEVVDIGLERLSRRRVAEREL